MKNSISKNLNGIILCMMIALFARYIGSLLPVIGGPVLGIIFGMCIRSVFKLKDAVQSGVNFTAKKILQYAVILLGFNLNISVIMQTGRQSLPVIASTIGIALITAFLVSKLIQIPVNTAVLVGVGSSICGGSAIAATAPVIDADAEEVSEAISVIFLFNVLAALIFPFLGGILGLSNEGFGLFAGTAVNDTSSVTAVASAWDVLHGSHALETATVVKLTRTLAIIPITFVLALYRVRRRKLQNGQSVSLKKIFPHFILFFLLASFFASIVSIPTAIVHGVKNISTYCIIMAMSAIGLNTNVVKLVASGKKTLLLGFVCWCSVGVTSLAVQRFLGIW